ncbi:hypothetical protein BH18THE2_BH18THE2_09220 [soil metagenome]
MYNVLQDIYYVVVTSRLLSTSYQNSIIFILGRDKTRVCTECSSNTTYKRNWCHSKITGALICSRCYKKEYTQKYREQHREELRKYHREYMQKYRLQKRNKLLIKIKK